MTRLILALFALALAGCTLSHLAPEADAGPNPCTVGVPLDDAAVPDVVRCLP